MPLISVLAKERTKNYFEMSLGTYKLLRFCFMPVENELRTGALRFPVLTFDL